MAFVEDVELSGVEASEDDDVGTVVSVATPPAVEDEVVSVLPDSTVALLQAAATNARVATIREMRFMAVTLPAKSIYGTDY